MVEKIDNVISYAAFVASCNPAVCTYTVTERRNIITIITVLLAILSGMNTAVKLVVSIIMKYFYQFFITNQGTGLLLIVIS